MALTHIPIEQITEAHLMALIEGKASETLHIEYKRQSYGTNDEARREFLADVSSFANSRGGDLLIGVAECDGVPSSLVPFTGNADDEKLRLDNIARSGLEPRIPNLHIQAVPIDGGWILVIRIPRSYRGPHRVIFKEWNRFFARSSAGRYQPNVEELRSLFAFAPELAEQMRALRFDRVTSIAADQTPVPLSDISRLVLHVIPFSHFDLRPAVSLQALIQNKTRLDPIGTPADATRLNFDGLLAKSYPENGTYQSYVQAFRRGAIEAVCSSITGFGGSIDIRRVEHYIVERSLQYATALDECGAGPPLAVMASVIGVEGRRLTVAGRYEPAKGEIADRDQLHLAEVVMDEMPADILSFAQTLRPTLDQLANAVGIPASLNFDEKGDYIPRR